MISRAERPEELKEQARTGLRETNPMKRFGTGEEIARAVAWLRPVSITAAPRTNAPSQPGEPG